MAFLPSFFVLQSGGKYLSVTENIPANLPSGTSGLLKFDEEPIWSPRVKFAVEAAAGGVHIRSCYNNKYLVMKQIETNSWIVASAKTPEEDASKDSCTLFEPYSLEDDETTSVRLRRPPVLISTTSSCSHISHTHEGLLLSSVGSVFNAIDWNSVLKLPSQVAFKSESLNSNYLRSIVLYKGLIYQKFESGFDIADPLVAKELQSAGGNGNYRIKDLSTGKFWRRRDNWIKGEDDNTSNESLFSFQHIQDNVFAVRNLGNNNFCGPVTEDQSIDCLNAHFPNISRQTRLIVEECVVLREIKDIVYRLNDSRIYDEQIIEVDHAEGANNTAQDNTMTLTLTQTDSRTTTFTNSESINFGVKVSMKVSEVPLIVESTVEISTEIASTREWGVSETTTTSRGANYTITIPPFTRMRVALIAKRGRCDVPFSYTQRDLLTSGTWVNTTKEDGLITGINSYSFTFQSTKV